MHVQICSYQIYKYKQIPRTLDQSSFYQITSFAKFYQRSNPKDLEMSIKQTFHSQAAFLNVYNTIHATFMDNNNNVIRSRVVPKIILKQYLNIF